MSARPFSLSLSTLAQGVQGLLRELQGIHDAASFSPASLAQTEALLFQARGQWQ